MSLSAGCLAYVQVCAFKLQS